MTYILTASYHDRDYRGAGNGETGDTPFNEAWQAIAKQLPAGEEGDVMDLDDAGCVGGSLKWDGEVWVYHPGR